MTTPNVFDPIAAWFGKTPITRSEVLAWEAQRAEQALRALGIPIPDGDVEARREALVDVKMTQGQADREWKMLKQISLSDMGMRKAAQFSGAHRGVCQVELFAPGVSAAWLPQWYMGRATANDEAVFLRACPDHHLFRMTEDGRQEVWETAGGSPLPSRFFFTLKDTETLVTAADPSYPIQMAGTARIADGTIIGGIRHQFRDEAGGTRTLLTVESAQLAGVLINKPHRWHLALEFSSWLEQARAARQ